MYEAYIQPKWKADDIAFFTPMAYIVKVLEVRRDREGEFEYRVAILDRIVHGKNNIPALDLELVPLTPELRAKAALWKVTDEQTPGR